MEQKTITVRQMAQIKNTAKNVAADVAKKNKIAEKIVALKKEYDEVSARVEAWQAPIRSMANGLTTEELVIREVKPYLDENGNQKVDSKNGNALTITTYTPNTKVVTFDEEKRVYVINTPVAENEGVDGNVEPQEN